MKLVKKEQSLDELKEHDLNLALKEIEYHKAYAQVLMKFAARVSAASTLKEFDNAVEWFEANEPSLQ